MAVTDLSRLRTQIADRPRLALNEDLGQGDGVTVHFSVVGAPVLAGSFSLFVGAAQQTEDVDFTLEYDLGLVTFSAAPSSGSAIRATYQWVMFSDEVLSDLLETMTVQRAAARAISWILADFDLFIKYTYGQESVDRSQARAALERLYDELKGADAPFSLVLADTPDREETMSPFIEQREGLLDDLQ